MKPYLALPIVLLLAGWFVMPASAQSLQSIRVGYPSISSRQAISGAPPSSIATADA